VYIQSTNANKSVFYTKKSLAHSEQRTKDIETNRKRVGEGGVREQVPSLSGGPNIQAGSS
jgi:hypothetical protein